MARMMIMWHTAADDRVCPICLPLNGHTWVYDTESNAFPNYLYSPRHGIVVWDVSKNEPRPHGDGIHNCRCRLTVDWDLLDVEERLSSIRSRALAMCGSLEVWRGGTQVQVLRSQGRFVSWRTIT